MTVGEEQTQFNTENAKNKKQQKTKQNKNKNKNKTNKKNTASFLSIAS